MKEIRYDKITVDTLNLPVLLEKQVQLSVLRLDKIHPQVSGNKIFKLKYYLQDARSLGKRTIVTFGGAYSNHIIATAAVTRMQGLSSIGVIRGEKGSYFSHTLKYAQEYGMELFFVSREQYREKKLPGEVLEKIEFNDAYVINEGGYGEMGMLGAKEILGYCASETFTDICSAVGTATMLAGLIAASLDVHRIVGISVMKNNFELEHAVMQLLGKNKERKNYKIIHDYHFDGYSKHNTELISFINDFYKATGIPTDFVYTGKLMFAVINLIQKDYFPAGSNILIIHSGGLQGNDSLKPGMLMF